MKIRSIIVAGALLGTWGVTNLAIAADDGPWRPISEPPSVQILSPQSGEFILLGQNIPICALALNFTDAVVRVEFLEGTNTLGVVTNAPGHKSGSWEEWQDKASCFTWSNAAVGAHILTAQATDEGGNTVTSAPVDISVVTNIPPVVRLVQPGDGKVIRGPTNVMICASAFDPGGSVANVAFFEDGSPIGVVTNSPPILVTNRHGVFPILQTSYCLTWSNVPPGSYTLTAVATDNGGVSSTSAPVALSVVTNLPPLVELVNPYDGASFFSPATIVVCADAKDPDGTVASVQFFEGSVSLGVVTNGTSVTNRHGEVKTTYCVTWSNVPPANYSLTAVATDNDGASSTSAVVTVSVVLPPPPLVAILRPNNGAKFIAPANIEIDTITRHFTNHIASVEFLSDSNILGVVTNSAWPSFFWKKVPAGAYSLSAIATDTGGNVATSAPVNITVISNLASHGPTLHR